MKLSAPTKVSFCIAIVLAVLALIGKFVAIPFVSANAFWFLCAGFVVLCLGCVLKNF